jgi:hypothetical protein
MKTIIAINPFKYHEYDHRTLVCKCGRTFEQHTNLELINEKVKELWFAGKLTLDDGFIIIDKAIQPPNLNRYEKSRSIQRRNDEKV